MSLALAVMTLHVLRWAFVSRMSLSTAAGARFSVWLGLVRPGLRVASISTLLFAAVASVCTIATSVIAGVERSVGANCVEVVGYVFESLLLLVNCLSLAN